MPRYKVHYSFTDEDYAYINAGDEQNARIAVAADLEGYKNYSVTKVEEMK